MGELDDGLSGVLGSETPEGEGPAPVAGADAVALALALQKANNDPALSRAASDYLAEQRHLVQIQIKHFDEERRLGIAAAKRRRYADYMRNGLYTCIALLVLGVLLAVARMTVEATRDHSLVVSDFTVPSDFAARGVTSQALAEDLASRLAAIRATANRGSLAPANEVRADQTDVLKVQIPETGISIDELERFLHRWLGHQTVVNGELNEEAGGQISIRLHIAGADPIVVTGAGADLGGLLETTAERAFEIYDPLNYAIYLSTTDHRAEAVGTLVRVAHSPWMATISNGYRAVIYSLWALVDPDPRHGLSIALIGTEVDPRGQLCWDNAASISFRLGHDQAALDFARKAVGTERREQPSETVGSYPFVTAGLLVGIDDLTEDFVAVDHDEQIQYRAQDALARLGGGNHAMANWPDEHVRYSNSAATAAALHDEATSRQYLARAVAFGPLDSTVLQARWDVSSAAGDWSQALDDAKALIAAIEAQKSAALKSDPQSTEFLAPRFDLELATQYRPLLAYAEAMTGDTASATTLISQTPTDCYLCVRTRAKVAAAASDAATADRWFSEAVRQAPDLPSAYYEWGQALLARGDLAGAAREFSLAHDKGPHWADPLKAWGDALAKQGHRSDALAEYDEALKYAPHWAALKQARKTASQAGH